MAVTSGSTTSPGDTDLPLHGGDLAAARARWGEPDAGWLDLSTGINPWPYPVADLPPEVWTRLPGSGETESVRRAAAAAYGTRPERVLAAAGTGGLIQVLPRLFPEAQVAIVSPTYGEHARAWREAGHHVLAVDDLVQAVAAAASVIVVVNPNNPDGRVWPVADLMSAAEAQARRGGVIVVDEAFGDTMPDGSVAPIPHPAVMVLRSFGKFFGLAGLRLGFLVAEPEMVSAVAARLGPWAVSGPALAIGTRALADREWIEATRQHLRQAGGRMDAILMGTGLQPQGESPLFRLVSHPRAPEIYHCLGRAGILVRAFFYRRDWLRIGLAADPGAQSRLVSALSAAGIV